MRKLALLATVCSALFITHLATAQQLDAGLGFGTLTSPGAAACAFSSSVGGLNCPEKGGLYPNISTDVIFHRRMGFGFDVAWKGGQGDYGGEGLPYRPILFDFNGVYQPRLGKKTGLDLSAGIGWQSTRFYSSNYTCSFVSCTNYTSSNHFLIDVGGGLRRYIWGHFFVRPEVHYYFLNNNTNDFTSNNLVRLGATVGYTIGPE